jgi:toxin secretion/phage lysis holin
MYMRLGTQMAGSFNKTMIAIGAVVGFMFGEWTPLLMWILVLQGLDIITGLLVGGHDHDISSHKMREGIKKKVGTWIALVLAHVIDDVLFGGGAQAVVLTATAFTMLAQEGLSITENLGKLGILVPVVSKYLIQIKEHGENAEIKLGEIPNTNIAGVEIIHTNGDVQTVIAEALEEEKKRNK